MLASSMRRSSERAVCSGIAGAVHRTASLTLVRTDGSEAAETDPATG